MDPSKKAAQKSHHYPRYDFGPRSRGFWKRRASKQARREHGREASPQSKSYLNLGKGK